MKNIDFDWFYTYGHNARFHSNVYLWYQTSILNGIKTDYYVLESCFDRENYIKIADYKYCFDGYKYKEKYIKIIENKILSIIKSVIKNGDGEAGLGFNLDEYSFNYEYFKKVLLLI